MVAVYAGYRWLSVRRRPAGPRQQHREQQMTHAQACAVLGIDTNPSRQAVIDAHRKLMQKLHPDKGGSAHLAQQLNEAKRVLLAK